MFYANGSVDTTIAETTYHQARFLASMPAVVVEKTVLLVDVRATLVDVRTPHPAPPRTYDPLNYASARRSALRCVSSSRSASCMTVSAIRRTARA